MIRETCTSRRRSCSLGPCDTPESRVRARRCEKMCAHSFSLRTSRIQMALPSAVRALRQGVAGLARKRCVRKNGMRSGGNDATTGTSAGLGNPWRSIYGFIDLLRSTNRCTLLRLAIIHPLGNVRALNNNAVCVSQQGNNWL